MMKKCGEMKGGEKKCGGGKRKRRERRRIGCRIDVGGHGDVECIEFRIRGYRVSNCGYYK